MGKKYNKKACAHLHQQARPAVQQARLHAGAGRHQAAQLRQLDQGVEGAAQGGLRLLALRRKVRAAERGRARPNWSDRGAHREGCRRCQGGLRLLAARGSNRVGAGAGAKKAGTQRRTDVERNARDAQIKHKSNKDR